jgi:cobalt/nickel transport system permease protein
MLNEIFSDCFAHKDNFLTRIDPRIKMVFVGLTIILILISTKGLIAAVTLVLSLSFLLGAKVPFQLILHRLLGPLGIASVILFTQIFFHGTTPILEYDFFGFHLVGYWEGLIRGFLIIWKVLGTVSLIIFLSMTTPVNKLLRAARWFKIPYTWIEIALLTYRYIFVLLEDVITIRNAQKVRLGYSNLRKSLKSLGELAGLAVIRAYDQSILTYEAMVLRGYTPNRQNITYQEKFKTKDSLAAFLFAALLFLLLVLNIVV